LKNAIKKVKVKTELQLRDIWPVATR